MSADLRPRPPQLPVDTTALFLDVDGTLVEIVSEPGGVHVPDDLCHLLERLKAATGSALALVSGRPFAGRMPVFVGDDVTDEAGFEMVNRRGGVLIRIGDHDRPTEARFRLRDVAAMQAWLAELLAAKDGRARAVA